MTPAACKRAAGMCLPRKHICWAGTAPEFLRAESKVAVCDDVLCRRLAGCYRAEAALQSPVADSMVSRVPVVLSQRFDERFRVVDQLAGPDQCARSGDVKRYPSWRSLG